jgi:hypothetical protein
LRRKRYWGTVVVLPVRKEVWYPPLEICRVEDERLDGFGKCQDEETTLGDYREWELKLSLLRGRRQWLHGRKSGYCCREEQVVAGRLTRLIVR